MMNWWRGGVMEDNGSVMGVKGLRRIVIKGCVIKILVEILLLHQC